MDRLAQDAALDILNIDPNTEHIRTRLHIPPASGGFGISSAKITAPAAHATSWARSLAKHAYPSTVLSNDSLTLEYLNQDITQLTQLGIKNIINLDQLLETGKNNKQQSKWHKEALENKQTHIMDNTTDQLIFVINASSTPGAAAWTQPPKLPIHHMTNDEFITAARLRAGDTTHTEEKSCTHHNDQGKCRTMEDVHGIHGLCCGRGGAAVKRHNAIVATLALFIADLVTGPIYTEQVPIHDDMMDQKKPDISYTDTSGITRHIDVSICTPHPKQDGSTSGKPGHLAKTREDTKMNKFSHLNLYPFVLEHLGRPGIHTRQYIRTLTKDLPITTRSIKIQEIWQTTSTLLQKYNAMMVATAGTLKPIRRF